MGGDDETRFADEIKGEQIPCELANGKSIHTRSGPVKESTYSANGADAATPVEDDQFRGPFSGFQFQTNRCSDMVSADLYLLD